MKICTIQPRMGTTPSENFETVVRWLSIAAGQQADLAVFPEMMLAGYDAHLHGLFSSENWYNVIEDVLNRLVETVDRIGVATLVGTPYLYDAGYLNAMVLLQPGKDLILAGARKIIIEGWRKRWGYTVLDRKDPVTINGISFGFIVCNEVSSLDDLKGIGLEDSEVIIWPGAIRNHLNEDGKVTRDGCREGAGSIAVAFDAYVIQSNYMSQISILEDNRLLGGSVICNAAGEIEQQAPYHEEAFLVCEIPAKDPVP